MKAKTPPPIRPDRELMGKRINPLYVPPALVVAFLVCMGLMTLAILVGLFAPLL